MKKFLTISVLTVWFYLRMCVIVNAQAPADTAGMQLFVLGDSLGKSYAADAAIDSMADTGIEIRVGKIGFSRYFTSFTSELSQSAGDVTTVTKFDNRQFLAAGETLIVECDGGKTGDGVVAIQVEMEGYR